MATPKLHKDTIPHALRAAVWDKYVGEDIGSTLCFCCSITKITQMKFECGHIQAESCGGATDVNNLLPICSTCNKSMGTKHLYDFMDKCGFKRRKIVKQKQNKICCCC